MEAPFHGLQGDGERRSHAFATDGQGERYSHAFAQLGETIPGIGQTLFAAACCAEGRTVVVQNPCLEHLPRGANRVQILSTAVGDLAALITLYSVQGSWRLAARTELYSVQLEIQQLCTLSTADYCAHCPR